MLESKFQRETIKMIKAMLPGCYVLKNDPNYIQGIPDLIVLYGNRWAALEVKKSENEPYQPNQEWYIEDLDRMSYATMICPENRELKLDELQYALRAQRQALVPVGEQLRLDSIRQRETDKAVSYIHGRAAGNRAA